jgi:hypothetical protein
MRRARGLLTGTLILLFLGLSFNAYACLLPIPGGASATMDRGCSAPNDQSARQFCDSFKTLGVQASPELHPAFDCQTISVVDHAAPSGFFGLPVRGSHVHDYLASGPPQDLLVKTIVLRL